MTRENGCQFVFDFISLLQITCVRHIMHNFTMLSLFIPQANGKSQSINGLCFVVYTFFVFHMICITPEVPKPNFKERHYRTYGSCTSELIFSKCVYSLCIFYCRVASSDAQVGSKSGVFFCIYLYNISQVTVFFLTFFLFARGKIDGFCGILSYILYNTCMICT